MAGLFKRMFQTHRRDTLCSVVVPAAGVSTRMAGEDKILMPLGEAPVLVHTLRALSACSQVDEIIVVTREELMVAVSQLCQDFALDKVRKVIRGGATRAQSVWLGIQEIRPDAGLIAIHDGARPLVTPELVERVIAAAAEHGAAAPAIPVKDTVKRARGGVVVETPERAELYAVQTPQVFDAALIRGALEKAAADGADFTDDCATVERLGMSVRLVEGEDTNLKLTTPADVWMAEGILNGRDFG